MIDLNGAAEAIVEDHASGAAPVKITNLEGNAKPQIRADSSYYWAVLELKVSKLLLSTSSRGTNQTSLHLDGPL
jgi:hypothetical protein